MFGFKKRTVEEILSAIEKLSDEEREKLLSALSGKEPPEQEEPEEEPTAEETETPPEEETENGEGTEREPAPEPAPENAAENAPENVETQAAEETPEPLQETPQGATEEAQEGQEPIEAPPVETAPEEPPALTQAGGVGDNTSELIAAQNAKIEALQSQLEAMQETLRNIVEAADNKDFGSSPEPDYSGENERERFSAVMQGYAGRRANDYK